MKAGFMANKKMYANPPMHMPPRDYFRAKVIDDLIFTKPYFIYLSKDPILPLYVHDKGTLWSFPTGYFKPKLPNGPVPGAEDEHDYTAIKPGAVQLVYYDAKTGITYAKLIVILP
jgi:hypothetical protein